MLFLHKIVLLLALLGLASAAVQQTGHTARRAERKLFHPVQEATARAMDANERAYRDYIKPLRKSGKAVPSDLSHLNDEMVAEGARTGEKHVADAPAAWHNFCHQMDRHLDAQLSSVKALDEAYSAHTSALAVQSQMQAKWPSWSDIKSGVSSRYNSAKAAVSRTADLLTDRAQDVAGQIGEAVSDVHDKVVERVSDVHDKVVERASDVRDRVVETSRHVRDWAVDRAEEAVETMSEIGRAAIEGAQDLVEAIGDSFDALTRWVAAQLRTIADKIEITEEEVREACAENERVHPDDSSSGAQRIGAYARCNGKATLFRVQEIARSILDKIDKVQKEYAILPVLSIVGISGNLNVAVGGHELLYDMETLERTQFNYGGVTAGTNIVSGVGVAGYMGLGWKGKNVLGSDTKSAYSKWFHSIDASVGLGIPGLAGASAGGIFAISADVEKTTPTTTAIRAVGNDDAVKTLALSLGVSAGGVELPGSLNFGRTYYIPTNEGKCFDDGLHLFSDLMLNPFVPYNMKLVAIGQLVVLEPQASCSRQTSVTGYLREFAEDMRELETGRLVDEPTLGKARRFQRPEVQVTEAETETATGGEDESQA